MEFDVIVIGAGPAGYVCAIRLAQLGKRVAVVEKARPGGTCLNIGCIPSKALIRAGRLMHEARGAATMGITIAGLKVDLETLTAWKDKVVDQVVRGVEQLFKLNKITHLRGSARVTAPGRVEVAVEGGESQALSAPEIVVATGSTPIEIPGFSFADTRIWSSTEALTPPFMPQRLVVIGGGVIGLELGLVYHNLGAAVTVVEALDGVLPGLDGELRKEMGRSLKKRKLKVLAEARAGGWREAEGGLIVEVDHKGKPKELEADAILVTVGRKPTDGGTGLADLGVAFDARGFVAVDGQGRTNVAGIRAMGDLAGDPLLAHKSSAQGLVVAAAIAGDTTASFAPQSIPGVVFTDPEIASTGLTSEETAAQGLDTIEGKFPMRALGRAVTLGALDGFVKIIAERESRKVIGVHMMGPEVSELIAAGSLAVEQELTIEQLAHTIQAHPTIGEALPEAAEAALGTAIHLFDMRKKR